MANEPTSRRAPATTVEPENKTTTVTTDMHNEATYQPHVEHHASPGMTGGEAVPDRLVGEPEIADRDEPAPDAQCWAPPRRIAEGAGHGGRPVLPYEEEDETSDADQAFDGGPNPVSDGKGCPRE